LPTVYLIFYTVLLSVLPHIFEFGGAILLQYMSKRKGRGGRGGNPRSERGGRGRGQAKERTGKGEKG
jgi:hypothetical protein